MSDKFNQFIERVLSHEGGYVNHPKDPGGGSPEQLLNHAVAYGTYCQKLEVQISGWQAWYQREKQQQ